MLKKLIIAAAAVSLAAFAAGCRSDVESEAAAAAPPSSAAPSPSIDSDRAACHALNGIDVLEGLNPWVARPAAAAAISASNPAIKMAGDSLLRATIVVEEVSDPRGTPNINLSRAWLDLDGVCIDLYGDGPW
jgi:hypothetical protein